jgi:hypothetical protein
MRLPRRQDHQGVGTNFEILDCNTDGILWDCNILILKSKGYKWDITFYCTL